MMGEKAETPTHYEQAEKILDSTEVWSVADRMLAAVAHTGLAIADQLSDLVVMQKLPGFTAPAGTIANGLIRTLLNVRNPWSPSEMRCAPRSMRFERSAMTPGGQPRAPYEESAPSWAPRHDRRAYARCPQARHSKYVVAVDASTGGAPHPRYVCPRITANPSSDHARRHAGHVIGTVDNQHPSRSRTIDDEYHDQPAMRAA